MMRTTNFTTSRIFVIGAIIVALAAIIALVVFVSSRPNQADYESAKTRQIGELSSARESLAPAVNEYLKSYKEAYNKSQSVDEATKSARTEYDAFKSAANKATAAMENLSKSRITNESQIGTATDSLESDVTAEIRYYTSLVEAYPEYTNLFATNTKSCNAIFIQDFNGFADRLEKLKAAVRQCQNATASLKDSKNSTYVDYANKIEKRVKLLQSDLEVVVKADAERLTLEKEAATFQQKLAAAEAANASDAEYVTLKKEIEALNNRLNNSRSNFDFSSKRYLDTTKELPEVLDAVFKENVPAKQKFYDQLVDSRSITLSYLLDSKVVTKS